MARSAAHMQIVGMRKGGCRHAHAMFRGRQYSKRSRLRCLNHLFSSREKAEYTSINHDGGMEAVNRRWMACHALRQNPFVARARTSPRCFMRSVIRRGRRGQETEIERGRDVPLKVTREIYSSIRPRVCANVRQNRYIIRTRDVRAQMSITSVYATTQTRHIG